MLFSSARKFLQSFGLVPGSDEFIPASWMNLLLLRARNKHGKEFERFIKTNYSEKDMRIICCVDTWGDLELLWNLHCNSTRKERAIAQIGKMFGIGV